MKKLTLLLILLLLATPAHASSVNENEGGTRIVPSITGRTGCSRDANGITCDPTSLGNANVTIGTDGTITLGSTGGRLGSSVNPNEYIDFNDAPVDDMILISGAIELFNSRIFFLRCDDDIETIIGAGVSGDTFILGSCTYTPSSNILISNPMTIIGQGPAQTLVSASSSISEVFNIKSDNVTLSNFAISSTGAGQMEGIDVDLSTVTSGSNVVLDNLKITMNASALQTCIRWVDTGGVISNIRCSTTSTTTDARGISINPGTGMDTASTLTIKDSIIATTGHTDAGDDSLGIWAQEGVTTQNMNINLQNTVITSSGASGTGTGYAISADGNSILLTCDNCTLSGTDADAHQANSAVFTIRNSTLVNNLTSGTLTRSGTTHTGAITVSGDIISTDTGNLGWTVVDGTDNTSCEDQCTSAAVFGLDLAAGATAPVMVGPTSAAADICLCAGGS